MLLKYDLIRRVSVSRKCDLIRRVTELVKKCDLIRRVTVLVKM